MVSIIHFDISANEIQKVESFYEPVFDWNRIKRC